MKKIFAAIFFMILLCGCTAMPDERELVEDSAVAAEAWSEDAADILLDLPADAELISKTDTWACYSLHDGEFEIITAGFLCSDTASAVHHLTGFEPNALNTLVKTSEYGEECFVTWCAMGEEGNRIYTADIVTDGIYAYCVICSFAEDAACGYDREIREVFSGFDLSGKNVV